MTLLFKKKKYAIVDTHTGFPIMLGFHSKKDAKKRIDPKDTRLKIVEMKKGWEKEHFLKRLM